MPKSSELLQALLANEEIPSARIYELVRLRVREDTWLDYKSGKELEKSKAERNRDLRRWISGFANAEGGVLLVGMLGGGENQTAWAIDGCEAKRVGGDLVEWLHGADAADLNPVVDRLHADSGDFRDLVEQKVVWGSKAFSFIHL